jgi:hypothetical protein
MIWWFNKLWNAKPRKLRWVIIAKEVGASGTPHLQGGFGLGSKDKVYKVSRTTLQGPTTRNAFARAALFISKGTPEQVRNYCSKQDPEPFILGSFENPHKTERKDIDDLVIAARAGKFYDPVSLVDHALENGGVGTAVRCNRFLLKVANSARHRDGTFTTELIWIDGVSGSGKSHRAHTGFCDVCERGSVCTHTFTHTGGDNFKWWDGYIPSYHTTVVLDNVHASYRPPYAWLLRWADKWAATVETKGDTRVFRPERIVITSVQRYDQVYFDIEDLSELQRRITQEIHLLPRGPIERLMERGGGQSDGGGTGEEAREISVAPTVAYSEDEGEGGDGWVAPVVITISDSDFE